MVIANPIRWDRADVSHREDKWPEFGILVHGVTIQRISVETSFEWWGGVEIGLSSVDTHRRSAGARVAAG